MKAVQGKRGQLTDPKVLNLFSKGAIGTEAGEAETKAATLMQQLSELERLTFGPALLKTVNQLKDDWFQ